MSGPTWKRPGTPVPRDRDVYVEKHAVPEEVPETNTGRIDLLENRLSVTEKTVARMEGKVDTLIDYAAKSDAERERRAAADAVAEERRRKYVIALIGAIGAAIAGIVAVMA